MKTLGLLDLDRLAHIPVSYWPNHEFCFYLHDQMLELLIQYETSGAHRWVTDAFEEVVQKHGKEADEIDIFEFLKEKELLKFYKHHLVSHLVFGLTSDMLNFLYESLRCFEKPFRYSESLSKRICCSCHGYLEMRTTSSIDSRRITTSP